MDCCLFRVSIRAFALAIPPVVPAQSISAPEITAQGFDISQPQVGDVGRFGRLRVRFESSLDLGIDKLVDASAQRQQRIQSKLFELSEETESA